MKLTAGLSVGHFLLLEQIGEGGMGVVWKAEDSQLRRPVALKFLQHSVVDDPDRQRRFLEEARLASQLSDARIAHIYEFGQSGELRYIAMEFIEGGTLLQRLETKPLVAREVIALGEQVARALARAHRRGLLHRDIKPSNVLVTAEDEIKLVDFGLAALMERRPLDPSQATTLEMTSGLRLPSDGVLAGTLPYMSPEQLRLGALDARTDVYSLGVTLYEMTTGRRPFVGANNLELVENILRASPTPVCEHTPSVPAELERVIHKAMAAGAGERYQTMDDLAMDLHRLGSELERGVTPRPQRPKIPSRWVVAASVVFVATLGVLWLMLGPRYARGDRRLLVLPFEVNGQEHEPELAGLAFAEGLTIAIAQSKGMTVLPVQTVAGTRPSLTTSLAAAARQRVELVLTGRLVRFMDSTRVGVQLVDTRSKQVRWGEQRVVRHADLSNLATELAHAVLNHVGASSAGLYESPDQLSGDAAVAEPVLTGQVVGAYLRHDYAASADLARRLINRRPRSIQAHAIHAGALGEEWYRNPTPANQKRLDEGLSLLDALDRGNPYSGLIRCRQLGMEGHHREAILLATTLLTRYDLGAVLRSEAHRLRAWSEIRLGNLDGALEDSRQACALDPSSSAACRIRSQVLQKVGRAEDALAQARLAVALDPYDAEGWAELGVTQRVLGQHDESLLSRTKACELARSQQPCAKVAIALLRLGRSEAAAVAAKHAASLTPSVLGQYDLACYFALTGQTDDALSCLERAVNLGFNEASIRRDSDLVSLRGNARFEALSEIVLARVGNQ